MAFYVQSAGNLIFKINDLLKEYFGDKAEVNWKDGVVYVKVKEGFPTVDTKLTSEQVAKGMMGGGRVDGLDGKSFAIEVTEIK